MPVNSPEFRSILGHWTTGVAVAAARSEADGALHGLTANAFCSLSLDPPLVLVCIEKSANTHDAILRAGAFAVSVLASDQETLARHFAGEDTDKFDSVGYRVEVTGAPILADALSWVDCRLHAHHDGGDHSIFVGEVMAGGARAGEPLVYYRGGYGRYAP